ITIQFQHLVVEASSSAHDERKLEDVISCLVCNSHHDKRMPGAHNEKHMFNLKFKIRLISSSISLSALSSLAFIFRCRLMLRTFVRNASFPLIELPRIV
ncbi:hypothetical protein FCV25MIE_28425, partial [Fagus crenata]